MNDMMKNTMKITMQLSNHFSYEELIRSNTAKRLGIDNTPTTKETIELKKLAVSVLETIRLYWGQPIIVTSGYRCPRLNAAVGGAKTSQHVYGQAADIRTVSDKPEDNRKLFEFIVKMINDGKINVGQLIDEYNYNWVHVSTPVPNHYNEILHIR